MFFIMIALWILADQLVKCWISSSMLLGASVPVISDVFHITYIQNPGAAFGLLAHQRWIFIAAGFVLLASAAYLYPRIKAENAWIRHGSAMLLGGAVGNLIDRIWLGRVIDFLDFRVWPVFNIADIGICVGVGCIVYAILTEKNSEVAP